MASEALPKKPVLTDDEYNRIPKKGEAREAEGKQMINAIDCNRSGSGAKKTPERPAK